MTFPKYKPSGWSKGQVIPAAALNQWDTQFTQALDGGAGGTFNPSSALIIGGAGITMSGPFTMNETTALGSAAALSGANGTNISLATGCIVTLGSSSNWTFGAYTDYVYPFPGPIHHDADGAEWVVKGNASRSNYYADQLIAAANVYFSVPIQLTNQATAILYTARVEGAAGHGGEPQYKPVLQLIHVDTDGDVTVLDSTTDTATVGGSYQLVHSITWYNR